MFDLIRRHWIAALLVGACLLAGPMATQAQVRKGWEYKRLVSVLQSAPFAEDKWIKYIGEEKFGNEVSSESLLNGLGGQGWELVSVVTSSHAGSSQWSGLTTEYQYFLKRPK